MQKCRSNVETFAVTKDTDALLRLIYCPLGQLKCVPLSWYIKTDSNQFININVIYSNLVNEFSDVISQLHLRHKI